MNGRTIKRIKKTAALALVAFCSISTIALAEYRILCELGEGVIASAASQSAAHSAHGGEATHSHSSGGTHSHSHGSSRHDHSREASVNHHSGHGPQDHSQPGAFALADSGLSHPEAEGSEPAPSSKEEDPCCDSVIPFEFSAQAYSPEFYPSLLTAVLAVTWITLDPSVLVENRQRFKTAMINAPPPFSLSHIPTTILLI